MNSDLKRDVNLAFELKLDKYDEFLEIINTIELIENTTINKIKPFDTFNKDIQSIERQQNDLNLLMIIIDEIKYEIERILFSNKSILFLNDLLFIKDKRFFFNENNIKILLILNDIYLKINYNNNNDLIHFYIDKLIYS